jgi:hypothetical protein
MKPRGTQWFVTALVAAGLFVAGGLGGAAQDATPAGGAGHAHPEHIHLGTCTASSMTVARWSSVWLS